MVHDYLEILRRHAAPLTPLPTGESDRFGRLEKIHDVLFDVYGTLFISASGDIGTLRQAAKGPAFISALKAVGCEVRVEGADGIRRLLAEIQRRHAALRDQGIEYPEVDIAHVWQSLVERLRSEGLLNGKVFDNKRLAIEYEARTNPVWPMPGVRRCLSELHERGLLLGIISNAQFFTPLLFPALLKKTTHQWGFDSALEQYSYRHGHAKPGEFLFRAAANILLRRGISSRQVLYVGNDMLNDIWPADKVGFQTVLFAGDARSLRRRDHEPRIAGLEPDAVLTNLAQLPDLIPP